MHRPADPESINAAARGIVWGCAIVFVVGAAIAGLAWLLQPRG